jgi:predicted Zn-dependent peptidase
MKKTLLTLLILGQMIMAATIQTIEVSKKNIPVIFEQSDRLPLVTIQFIFENSGTISDGKKAGLAKFSAKVMGEGTQKLGSLAFAEALESKAIHISASVGKETFVLEVGCLKNELDIALKYFAQLLKDPNFSQSTIEKVKTTTIGSISSKASNFDYVASNELKSILYKGTPLANPSSGTIESVKSITLSDVKNFINSHLVSSKLIVAVGGDVEIKTLNVELSKIIADLPEGELLEVKHYMPSADAKEKVLLKETQQAYVYFGSPYNMMVDDEDYYKARVAMFILGAGGFGSRLMEEIRVKRGLAYSAYASVHVTKSSSSMSGYLQTKLDSLDEAKATIKEVITKFVKQGVSKLELAQTKKFLLGSEPLRVETMSQRLNRTFQEYYRGYDLGHSKKELEKIENLKLDDLNQFIKQHNEILQMSFAIVTK